MDGVELGFGQGWDRVRVTCGCGVVPFGLPLVDRTKRTGLVAGLSTLLRFNACEREREGERGGGRWGV